MGKSWRIATVRGIPIKIHWLFFLLPLFYAVTAGSISGAVRMVVLILLLFACVVLHELGHSIAAQHYGIEVREITLWPLGGLAQLAEMPRKPVQELVIALAGPLVNVLIFIVLALVGLGRSHDIFSEISLSQQALAITSFDLLRELALLNVVLVVFNLIPAFPMDGGRVLRASLGFVLSRERATYIAMWVGRLFAAGFVILGIYSTDLVLIFIGIFVFSGAGAEYRSVRREAELERLQAADVARPAASLHPLDLLGHIVPRVVGSEQQLYPVVDGLHLEGTVTPEKLVEGMQMFGPATPVERVISPPRQVVPATMPLADLYQLMSQHQWPAVLVFQDSQLLGEVTAEVVTQVSSGK